MATVVGHAAYERSFAVARVETARDHRDLTKFYITSSVTAKSLLVSGAQAGWYHWDVVAVDPDTFVVHDSKSFGYEVDDDSDVLEVFLDTLEEGTLVLVSAFSLTGWVNISEATRGALERCGAALTDQLSNTEEERPASYALIGTKGGHAYAEEYHEQYTAIIDAQIGFSDAEAAVDLEVNAHLLKPPCNTSVKAPPVAGFLKDGNLILDEQCRHELLGVSALSACLQGTWLAFVGASQQTLAFGDLVNLLVDGHDFMDPDYSTGWLYQYTFLDVIIRDGQVIYYKKAQVCPLARLDPEASTDPSCLAATSQALAEAPTYDQRATRLTKFMSPYFDRVRLMIPALKADVGWATAQIVVHVQVLQWYMYSTFRKTWLTRKDMVNTSVVQSFNTFEEDMSFALTELDSFCGSARVRSCYVLSRAYVREDIKSAPLKDEIFTEALKTTVLSKQHLRYLDAETLTRSMVEEGVGAHYSQISEFWGWQIVLGGICDVATASTGNWATFSGATCSAAQATFDDCPSYTKKRNDCNKTHCELWECIHTEPCKLKVVYTKAFIPCPPGSYDVSGSRECAPCPPGTFKSLAGVALACTACSAGSYAAASGVSECALCSAGHYTDQVASTECATCKAGHFSSVGALQCSACSAGSYAVASGSSDCTLCSAGHFTNQYASTECAPCKVGHFSSAGAVQCLECSTGKFSSKAGTSECAFCPAGNYAQYDASTECSACSTGRFSSDPGSSECISCSAGSHADKIAAAECSICAPGYFAGAGASYCSKCSSGTFTNASGASECTPCDAGSFAGNSGSSACTLCKPGMHLSEIGGTFCTQCAKGSFASNAGLAVCNICPMHTYANQTGMTQCALCPSGRMTSTEFQSECTEIPADAFFDIVGSWSISFYENNEQVVLTVSSTGKATLRGSGISINGQLRPAIVGDVGLRFSLLSNDQVNLQSHLVLHKMGDALSVQKIFGTERIMGTGIKAASDVQIVSEVEGQTTTSNLAVIIGAGSGCLCLCMASIFALFYVVSRKKRVSLEKPFCLRAAPCNDINMSNTAPERPTDSNDSLAEVRIEIHPSSFASLVPAEHSQETEKLELYLSDSACNDVNASNMAPKRTTDSNDIPVNAEECIAISLAPHGSLRPVNQSQETCAGNLQVCLSDSFCNNVNACDTGPRERPFGIEWSNDSLLSAEECIMIPHTSSCGVLPDEQSQERGAPNSTSTMEEIVLL